MCNKSTKRKQKFHLTGLLLLIAGILLQVSVNAQTYSPTSYYTFDGANPLSDSMTGGNLNPYYYSSYYTIGNNTASQGVGKFMTNYASSTIIKGADFIPDSGLTVEFLLRPGSQFDNQTLFWSQNGSFTIKMGFPYINFNTTAYTSANVAMDNNFKIDLNDIGRKSYGYYVDGNWHHLVFKMNAKTGVKQVWIDGQNPTGFQTTATTNCHFKAGTYNALYINSNTSYVNFRGDLDEIATYQYDLHPNMIYKHYQNFQNHLHYSFQWTATAPPAASSIAGSIDLNEYAPGHPNVTVTQMDQLKSYPGARFRPNHTLMANGTYVNYAYLAGYHWPGVTDYQAVVKSVDIQKILFKNYNFAIQVSGATTEWPYFGDTTKFSGAWIKLANDNSTVPATINTAWPHVIPSEAGFKSTESYTTNKTLPGSSYLQNSSGQFIDLNGNVTTNKTLAPDAPCDSIIIDAKTQRFYFTKLFQKLTRPLEFINDEWENLPMYNTGHAGPPVDASVLADKNASGLDWYTYFGKRFARFCHVYVDTMMTLPQLANTKIQFYESEGHDFYRQKYSEMRTVQTPINGTNYPVPSIYTRFPYNWRQGTSAWNGWKWYSEARANEISYGDFYCTPAVGAGWDSIEENNIRPGQWLGLCKGLAMAGGENFFPAFFVLGGTAMQNPNNYAWQVVMPAYAQAITSRYEDLFRNGYVMQGDMPLDPANPTGPKAYSFLSGDMRKLVVVRKSNTGNKYAITGTIQPSSNMTGNTDLAGNATIMLDGQNLKFNVRRQGSTYIYDNTNPSSPVFYMLDGWHEYSHPSFWTKNFEIEAELFDNNNSKIKIKTELPSGTAAGDFTNFTSYAGFTATTNAKYNFSVRGTSPTTYYFWVRARSKGGSSGMDIAMDGTSSGSVNCVTDTNWTWYRMNSISSQPIIYTNLSVDNHELTITAQNAFIEIDKILLTTQSGAIYGNGATTCTPVTATITAGGPTTFCFGANVTLTANTSSTYQWSTGATTKSITVHSSGAYTVTVSNTSGATAVSSPVTIVENSLPVAAITSSAGDSLCMGASLTLTSASATSYLWNGGSTSKSILASASGSYTVTVTNSNGCSSSTSFLIRNGICPVAVSITANGPTSFCTGGNVVLNANTSNAYLWSTGATTKSITAAVTADYTVTVTDSYGQTGSTSVHVEAKPTPVASIASSAGDSLCPGTTMILTASSTNSYLWSTGSVAKSIVISSSGTYTVMVTNSSGCSSTASFVVKTGYCPPPVAISANGPTTFCTGGSVALSANTSAAYLWSTGSTAQSITVIAGGNYTVRVSDAYGQSATTSIKVTVNSKPVVSVSSNAGDTLCPGSSIVLQANGTGNCIWSNGSTAHNITVASTGTYIVSVTNSAGCSATASFIAVHGTCALPNAAITSNGNTTICQGASVIFTALPGYTYMWSTGATTQSITVTTPGAYNVIVTNWYGATASSPALTVTVNPVPAATVTSSGQLAICAPATVTLTVSQAYTYLWSTGATTKSIVVSQPGSYFVTATNNKGCINTSVPVNVTTGNCNPSCPAPYNLSQVMITDTSARIKWEKTFVSDSVQYVCTNMTTGISVSGMVEGSRHAVTIKMLAPATNYKWSLKAKCGSALSASSDTLMFTTLSGAVRMGDASETNAVSIYPNPTRDEINIVINNATESNYRIAVKDVNGKTIRSWKYNSITGGQTINANVSDLSPGVYFVVLMSDNDLKQLKFIKQ